MDIIFYGTAFIAAIAGFFALSPVVLLASCVVERAIWDEHFGDGNWKQTLAGSGIGLIVFAVCYAIMISITGF